MNQKQIKYLGYLGSLMSVLMYVSYVAQIIDNLHGHKGNIIMPIAAFCNCTVWTIYGFLVHPREWPIILANVPGIVITLITILTAFS